MNTGLGIAIVTGMAGGVVGCLLAVLLATTLLDGYLR